VQPAAAAVQVEQEVLQVHLVLQVLQALKVRKVRV
jgi:hypothetical protein